MCQLILTISVFTKGTATGDAFTSTYAEATVTVTGGTITATAYIGGGGGITETGSGGWTQQVTSPQTGDSSNIGLWLSLVLLSFSGIVALLVTEKVRCAERRTRKPRTR